MRRAWLAMVLILVVGCEGNKPPPPTDLKVGPHHIQVQIPEGWERVNYGDRHLLRKERTLISIERIKWRGDDFDEAISNGLKNLKEGEQRDEASRTRLTVGGKDAVLVETWDRLSHNWPRRFLFVWSGQDFVVLYTMAGAVEEAEPVFKAFTASFAFADSLEVAE